MPLELVERNSRPRPVHLVAKGELDKAGLDPVAYARAISGGGRCGFDRLGIGAVWKRTEAVDRAAEAVDHAAEPCG